MCGSLCAHEYFCFLWIVSMCGCKSMTQHYANTMGHLKEKQGCWAWSLLKKKKKKEKDTTRSFCPLDRGVSLKRTQECVQLGTYHPAGLCALQGWEWGDSAGRDHESPQQNCSQAWAHVLEKGFTMVGEGGKFVPGRGGRVKGKEGWEDRAVETQEMGFGRESEADGRESMAREIWHWEQIGVGWLLALEPGNVRKARFCIH